MLKWIVGAAMLVACALPAHAQNYVRITNCGDARPPAGASQGYMDSHGNVCGTAPAAGSTVTAPPYTGNGALALTTASALINTMTVSATGATLPATLSNLAVVNNGLTDLAVCMPGGTCTCSVNAVATTNGLTVKAGGGSYSFRYSIASSTPSIVACSGTPTAEFQW